MDKLENKVKVILAITCYSIASGLSFIVTLLLPINVRNTNQPSFVELLHSSLATVFLIIGSILIINVLSEGE